MKRGPFPLSKDGMRLETGIESPFTPMFKGERVAMRASWESGASRRGPGYKGVVVDLDDGKRYSVFGMPCNLSHCYCDAEIIPITEIH